MEIPVYLLDESNTYSDFTKVMRNIMGIEELRDPLGSRMNGRSMTIICLMNM